MGLWDLISNLLSGGVTCPACGTEGARKNADGSITCKNPTCRNFNVSPGQGPAEAPAPRQRGTNVVTHGNFRPNEPVTIRYRNFAGQDRTFEAEKSSIVRKKNHLVARVAPTGGKITLSRDRIQNLSDVEAQMPQRLAPGQAPPSRKERQVLGYHQKHGTTSALYEEIRAKYPNW